MSTTMQEDREEREIVSRIESVFRDIGRWRDAVEERDAKIEQLEERIGELEAQIERLESEAVSP